MADITKASFNLSGRTLRCVRITVHPLFHYTEDERCQMAFLHNSTSLLVHTYDLSLCWIVVVEPFPLFFQRLISQCYPMLRGYSATFCFEMRLTSPDSLHMQFDADEIILKYCWCVRGYFCKTAGWKKWLKKTARMCGQGPSNKTFCH